MDNVISIVEHHVEKPAARDLEEIAVLVNQCWHETYDDHLPDSICRQRDVDVFFDLLSPFLERSTIVRKGDRIVGYCASVSNCIEHLWVDSKYRRKRIGSVLLEAQLKELVKRDYQSVQAGCESFNEAAIGFYASHGWQVLDESVETIAPGLNIGVVVYGYRLQEIPASLDR